MRGFPSSEAGSERPQFELMEAVREEAVVHPLGAVGVVGAVQELDGRFDCWGIQECKSLGQVMLLSGSPSGAQSMNMAHI